MEQTIDLSDKDAWDDSALIRAYERAVQSYQTVHGGGDAATATSGNRKHVSRVGELDMDEGEEEEEDEEEELDEEDEEDEEDEDDLAAREIAAAEEAAAAEAEAAEEARLEAWAQYYTWQQQQAASAGGGATATHAGASSGSAPSARPQPAHRQAPPPPPMQPAAAAPPHCGHVPPPMQMPMPQMPSGSGAPQLSSSTADYETDLSNLIMAWYHVGFFTARFQERHGPPPPP